MTSDRPTFLWATLILVAGLRAVGVALLCALVVALPSGALAGGAPPDTYTATNTPTTGPACVPSSVTGATLEIAADDLYVAYINGVSIVECSFENPSCWDQEKVVDVFAIDPTLINLPPADNVLAVYAADTGVGASAASWKLTLTFSDCPTQTVVSDGYCTRALYAGKYDEPPLVFPPGWENLSFDDSTWVGVFVGPKRWDWDAEFGAPYLWGEDSFGYDTSYSAFMYRQYFSAGNGSYCPLPPVPSPTPIGADTATPTPVGDTFTPTPVPCNSQTLDASGYGDSTAWVGPGGPWTGTEVKNPNNVLAEDGSVANLDDMAADPNGDWGWWEIANPAVVGPINTVNICVLWQGKTSDPHAIQLDFSVLGDTTGVLSGPVTFLDNSGGGWERSCAAVSPAGGWDWTKVTDLRVAIQNVSLCCGNPNFNDVFIDHVYVVVDAACATFTSTPTLTRTYTPSGTATYTPTPTYTFTWTPTFTLSDTPTFTSTLTYTWTWTPTFTPSSTFTYTPTWTRTLTNTWTPTWTLTFSQSSTPTFTPTDTWTSTRTGTFTSTDTPTASVTYTPTYTDTPTYTWTPTETPPPTFTYTSTYTPTFTTTDTLTASETLTDSPTVTTTFTYTYTPTASVTFTPTSTNSPTLTHTPTWSPPPTHTWTSTWTPTFSASNTLTYSTTWTMTSTPTWTPTASATYTHTTTSTSSFTESTTPTWTSSQTHTPTHTTTSTSSYTETATGTWTPTSSWTPTYSASNTLTSTPTASATSTWSPTITSTATPTSTWTMTGTALPTATVTPTFTETPYPPPNLDIVVISSKETVYAEKPFELTTRIENLGASLASPVTIKLTIPDGMVIVDAGSGIVSGNEIIWVIGTLAPGGVLDRTITVDAQLRTAGTELEILAEVFYGDPILAIMIQDDATVMVFVSQPPFFEVDRNAFSGPPQRIRIRFASALESPASLTVYNSAGELIKRIGVWTVDAGVENRQYWDGTNQNGEIVASGIYLLRLEVRDLSHTRRVAVIR